MFLSVDEEDRLGEKGLSHKRDEKETRRSLQREEQRESE